MKPAKSGKPKATRMKKTRTQSKPKAEAPPNKGKGKRQAAESSGESDEEASDHEHNTRQRAKKRAKVVEVEDIDEAQPEVDVVEVSDEEEYDTDELDKAQGAGIPNEVIIKEDSSRDLLVIFSDRVTVRFKLKGGGGDETVIGRWCMECRKKPNANLRKCFHRGGNLSLRVHIRQHYTEYKDGCELAGIPINHRAIPRPIWNAMKAAEQGSSEANQAKLNTYFKKEKGTKQFDRKNVLDQVAKFVACDDQSLATANKAAFRNCLVAMRPQANKLDLPTTHDITTYIHNQFVAHLAALKVDIQSAPGKISATADGWSADTTKASFLGMTAHWIDTSDKNGWKMRAEVVGFRGLSGEHSSRNLGRYLTGLCERVGIIDSEKSKLYTLTLDNASNNGSLCKTVESIHARRKLAHWSAKENQLPCLKHVVNLADMAVMSHITKIAAIENSTAIWEYDPTLITNRVLGGSLDVIAAIRTLAIKIQSSDQRIKQFEKIQIQCGITTPLKIPLHSNTRWGTAFGMLNRAYRLRSAINLFVVSADELYGSITTVRRDGYAVRHIPWLAFKLSESDWGRVLDASKILEASHSNRLLHHFSAERQPTLYRVLPAIEDLQTAWEAQAASDKYRIYHNAIHDGLAKLKKYYSKFDEKPAYVLALALHPYYKLAYIQMAWGGPEEQEEEIAAGNPDAKDWQDEAQKIVERKMAEYWKTRPKAPMRKESSALADEPNESTPVSDFDRHRQTLVTEGSDEGWAAELRRYLADLPADVTKETDPVKWWSDNKTLYPTLARIALDVLPSQASSVPCERLFSGSKQTASDRRSRLGSDRFEELQIMKSTWRGGLGDLALENSLDIEEIELGGFGWIYDLDNELKEWDKAEAQPAPDTVVWE